MQTSNIFFSIIIPVYNGLSHDLPICLDSIWSQDLSANLYEVICVDDCSTDSTYEWLQNECNKHENLVVLRNKENRRQGGARNHGVEYARGKYLMFIDQDDYYHKNSLYKVYKHLQEYDLDILVNDSVYQFKGFESNKKQLNLQNTQVMTSEEYIQTNGWTIAPWRLTINLEYYKKFDFKFVEKCRIEDVDWGVNLMRYAKRVQYFPHIQIHYNKAESGTTDNMYHDLTILKDNILAGNRTLKLGKNIYSDSPIQHKVFQLAATYYWFSVKYMFGLASSLSEKKGLLRMIPDIRENKRIVKFATKHPFIFSILSNLTVPVFKIARYFKRKHDAKKFQEV